MRYERHIPDRVLRSPPLRTVVFAAICVAALFFLIVLTNLVRNTIDPSARALYIAEAQRQAEINQAVQPIDVLVATLWRIIPPFLLIATAGIGLAIAWRRWGWRESISAHYIVQATQAGHQQLPANLHTLHYHTPRTERPAITAAPALLHAPDETADSAEIDAPSFQTLLTRGTIGRDSDGRLQPLILGYSSEGAVTGDWRSLYSSGVGGLQGSGKTWTAAYLLTQSALAGAQLVICDPHAGDEESLAARVTPLAPAFLCEVAEDDRAILNAVKLADAELRRRKHGDPNRTPLIVAIDEWSSLRRGQLADELPTFVEDFSTEGRKLNCHVMLLGQRWDKASVGDFRNTLASSYVHRMRTDEARMMTGLRASALPADTIQLPPGCAYLMDTRGTLTRVQIPHITAIDIAAVGQQITISANKSTRPFGFQIKQSQPATQPENSQEIAKDQPAANADYSATQSQLILSAEDSRIVDLFLAGKDAGHIVTELTGMTSKAGKPYLVKLAEVQAIIRSMLRQQLPQK